MNGACDTLTLTLTLTESRSHPPLTTSTGGPLPFIAHASGYFNTIYNLGNKP